MQRPLILLAGLLAGGTAGYFPLRQRYIAQQEAFESQLRQVRAEARISEQRSRLAEAVARLGGALAQAEQRDYARAQRQADRFFVAAGQAHEAAPDGPAKQALAQALARRGEITADLAASRATVLPKLRQLHDSLEMLLE